MIEKFLTENEIIALIKEYVECSNYNYAVLIDGSWGSGKTYFTQQYLIPEINNYEKLKEKEGYTPKKALYLSLYGMESTVDISNLIYMTLFNEIGKEKKLFRKLENKITPAVNAMSDIFKNRGYQLGDYKEVLNCFCNLKNYILVFDDLERCNCDINEVLGYINNFVEHDKIKVIIIGNENEIGRWDASENIELKYLLASGKNIKYDTHLDEETIHVSNLKDRANLIFNTNIRYNKIKEKLIGVTIKYSPNLYEINKMLIESNVEDENLKEILYTSLEETIQYSIKQQHINLRTYQFFLSKIVKINELVKQIEYKNYEEIMKKIVLYCNKVCVLFKSGDYQSPWQKDNLYGKIRLGKNEDIGNTILGFKFIDQYVIYSKFDSDEIIKSINLYLKEQENIEKDQDPFYNYERWWELNLDELKIGVKKIFSKLSEGYYTPDKFPRLLLFFIQLHIIGFDEFWLEKIIEEMRQQILKSNEEINLDTHSFIIQDNEELNIYKDKIQQLKELFNQKKNSDRNNQLNACIENIDCWGENLYKLLIDNKNVSLEKKSFISELDMQNIFTKIKDSDSKNIAYFRYVIGEIYDFSNIRDYYMNDLNNLISLRDLLNKIDKNDYDIIKNMNIQKLKELLGEKINMMTE